MIQTKFQVVVLYCLCSVSLLVIFQQNYNLHDPTIWRSTTSKKKIRPHSTWPPVQQALCGAGVPNLKLSSTLFDLARYEVFGKDDPRVKALASNTSLFENRFYSGDYGATVYADKNEKGEMFYSIYVRIWKCGNNQIREMLEEIWRSSQHPTKLYITKSLGQVLREYRRNQIETPSFIPEPCIYTAIRDPISHFLSGYNEFEWRLLESKQKIIPPQYDMIVPYSPDNPERHRDRFRSLVETLLLRDPKLAGGQSMHFYPMSRVLKVLEQFNFKLDAYIPQLTNLTETLPAMMSSTCKNFLSPESIPPLHLGGFHKTSGDPLGLYKAAKDVWKESGPTARALCLILAFDYACFEDLPDGIPELCRSVYEEYADEIIEIAHSYS